MNSEKILIERYQNIGRVLDKNGKVIQEGVNWLEGIETVEDKIALTKL